VAARRALLDRELRIDLEHLGPHRACRIRQYLNHWHEAVFGIDHIAKTFGPPLPCHENERRSVSVKGEVSETFSERHMN
jgi:hypothetical protein